LQSKRLVEETEAHVIILLLLRLSLLLLSGSVGGGSRSRAGSRGSGGVRIGVGDAVLELVDGLPLVLGLDGNSDGVLVGVDKAVHDRGKSGVVGSQGDAGDGVDGRGEGLEELGLLDVKHIAGEGLTLVVDLRNSHTVGERRDVKQVKEGGLGGSDLGAGLNELEVGGDLNGTTGNLGGDTKSLEERGLAGLHTSVSGGDVDIEGSDSTGTGRGSDTVVEDETADLLEVLVGEDEANVALDEGKETLVLGVLGDEALERTADLK
jgi:hypothetical protein